MDRTAVALALALALLAAVALHSSRTRAQDGLPPPGPPVSSSGGHASRLADPLSGPAPAGTRLYVVERGDTLYSIALRFGTTVSVLQTLNGIDDPNYITVGQVLRVPDLAAAGAEPALPALAAARPSAPYGPYGAGRVSEAERHLLASLIWLEARGEPFEGQVAVGAVVLNRVRHPAFPDTILEVVTQPGQFPFPLEVLQSTRPGPSAYAAADRALAGEDPSGGALYFYNPAKTTTPEFWATRPVVARIGNHVFTR